MNTYNDEIYLIAGAIDIGIFIQKFLYIMLLFMYKIRYKRNSKLLKQNRSVLVHYCVLTINKHLRMYKYLDIKY